MSDLDVHLPAIASGDADAFGRWLASAEAPLRRSLRSFAAVVDTEAVLQESLLRVWQVAPEVEVTGSNSLLRLAHRITRNLALSEARKRRAQVAEVEDTPLEPAPPDPLLRRLIASCREKLPKKPGLALHARLDACGGAPDASLAEGLGMSKNTFLQNFGRARKLLRACLERALAKEGVALEEMLR